VRKIGTLFALKSLVAAAVMQPFVIGQQEEKGSP
jgi:hypothetical protein